MDGRTHIHTYVCTDGRIFETGFIRSTLSQPKNTCAQYGFIKQFTKICFVLSNKTFTKKRTGLKSALKTTIEKVRHVATLNCEKPNSQVCYRGNNHNNNATK